MNLLTILVLAAWYAVQPAARREEVNRLLRNSFERGKHVSPLDMAWDIYQLYYSSDYVTVGSAPGDRTHAYSGLPSVSGGSPDVRVDRLLVNQGYIVGYDERLPGPRWVAYRCEDITPLPSPAERPDSFATDPRTIARVGDASYKNSGYDRGHLAPNRAIATRYGASAQQETFLLSNIVPQKHALNAGIWKQLETRIATSYPARFGVIWTLVGPVFGQHPATLGADGPAVPEAFYMILIDESDDRLRSLAFLFPQEANGDPDSYLTTIDVIESRTGLDFLAALPDEAENALEASVASRVW